MEELFSDFSAKLNLKEQKSMDMSSALVKIGRFLEPALTFLNCHFADYYLRSYWEQYIPNKLRQDLESKSLEEVKACMTGLVNDKWKSYSSYGKVHDFNEVSNLEELVVSVGMMKLSEQNLCFDYKTLQENRNTLKERFPKLFVDLEFDNFMSSKKMHEVLQFSEFIACTCDGVNFIDKPELRKAVDANKGLIRNVVDVGSGKGYLSSFLSMYYDLRVLAIDAFASNTEGCDKRSAKLDKSWPHLVRRAKERRDTGTAINHGRNWRKKLAKIGLSLEEYQKSLEEQVNRSDGNLKSVTEMITTKTDLQGLVDSSLRDESESKGQSEIVSNPKLHYGIVGLHTCGNLGANILKLFLHNEGAQFACVVPCCYNLVREDESLYPETVFYGSKFGFDEDKSGPWPDGSIGFPLSSALKSYEDGRTYVLGRNARMLSAYSLPRMVKSGVRNTGLTMPPVIHYRALLQIFLKHHGILPDNHNHDDDLHVGRMRKKCSNFRDYATFALEKFGIDAREIMLNDGSIEEIESKYATQDELDKFQKYYLLRTLFASTLEDLILLDRLVFLLEQANVEDAYIVQLFDPALSPRSHAIVAIKR